MDNLTTVERLIRDGWVGGNTALIHATVPDGRIRATIEHFRSCFTDLSLIHLDPLIDSADGRHVSCHGSLHLRQVADFLHVKAVGRAADTDFTAIYRLEDGQVVRMWIDMDLAQLYIT